eukprot:TRINITY_DN66442_c2_g2_i1.p1 TRINITY_DN66442_c2_g2~~TRINITY_DN66442_c2_g2_i1.p1  ORF type:complete len:208 (-),score=6.73 TRINITY_DN66442_c2_g2_i1:163-786(-)
MPDHDKIGLTLLFIVLVALLMWISSLPWKQHRYSAPQITQLAAVGGMFATQKQFQLLNVQALVHIPFALLSCLGLCLAEKCPHDDTTLPRVQWDAFIPPHSVWDWGENVGVSAVGDDALVPCEPEDEEDEQQEASKMWYRQVREHFLAFAKGKWISLSKKTETIVLRDFEWDAISHSKKLPEPDSFYRTCVGYELSHFTEEEDEQEP